MPRQIKYPATLSVRMSAEMWASLQQEAAAKSLTPAEVTREALAARLWPQAPQPEAVKRSWWRRSNKA
jgi:predicted transcriptional regulator